ncbi:DolP-mannose mannosyltransferase [Halococcoides cellulosivorans]|uniref:Glycosyltransferase RgtA/B/C/D-like domain-containing protein n=1 Tax=Halococcoides cellulosivorans TaxID=1679096 RepID=A0A2R4WXY0_9EURY|nr:DolP-mannose mannosyltransferase [Halococcoides cellulosivorans]AWB26402.1 hypothetical protein HARCEL1_01025 [Halococcoides cellulosivorans]
MPVWRTLDRLADRWGAVLVGTALFFHLLPIVFNAGLPPIDGDSALFQYMGWSMTQGGLPYVDIWDLKPPLIYYVTAGLGALTRGNVHVLHLAGVSLTTATAVGSVLALGTITHRQTGDRKLALAAGLSLLSLPAFYQIPLGGVRPKYFALLFGLVGLYLILEEHPGLAGASTAIAAGFWHWAAIYPLLAVAIAILRSRRQALWVVASGLVVTILVLVPFAVRGALDTMIAEVVLTMLLVGSESQFVGIRVVKLFVVYGYGSIVVPLGVLGAAMTLTRRYRRDWWIAAGTGWFLVQILVVDFDWRADLLHLAAFFALGIGVLGSHRDLWRRLSDRLVDAVSGRSSARFLVAGLDRHSGPSIVLGVAILAALAGPVWAGGMELVVDVLPLGPIEPWIPHKAPVVDLFRTLTRGSATVEPPPRYGLPDLQDLFLSKSSVPECHVRLSTTERNLMEALEVTHETTPCGDFDRYWEALVG